MVRGFVWNFISLLIRRGLGLIVQLVLAKILFPEEFGLVGMAMVFTTFVGAISNGGIGSALIQMKEEDLKPVHLHTAFWVGIGWSVLLYGGVHVFVAPLVADFYGEPVLEQIVPVIALSFLFGGVNVVQRAVLTRRMDFKKLAILSNTGSAVGGLVAVLMALTGFGVWSLVAYYVIPTVVEIPLLIRATDYLPKRKFDRAAFDQIISFGLSATGTSIVVAVITQADYLVIGKLVSTHAVGVYTFAFVLTSTLKNNLISIVNSVMFPAFSQVQHDRTKMAELYLKTVRYNAAIVYALAALLLVVGGDAILYFFGDKWAESIPLVEILTISIVLHMMVSGYTLMLRSVGKPKLEFSIQFVKGIFVFLPALYFGVLYYGVLGAAWVVAANMLIAVGVGMVVLYKFFGLGPAILFRAFAPALLALGCSLAAGHACRLYFSGNYFVVTAILAIVIYGLVLGICLKDDLRNLLSTFRERLKLRSLKNS